MIVTEQAARYSNAMGSDAGYRHKEAGTRKMGYEFASAENIGDRKEQQDRVALTSHARHADVVMAVLADGMGGHAGGAIASQAVIDAVTPMFDAFDPATGSPRDWLKGMLMAAHDKVAKAGRGFDQDPRSTGVIALAQKNRIDWAHCGDSRLYAFRHGDFVTRTEDHSMVEILVQQGSITADQAHMHPDRSKLFTSLGGPEAPQIAYGQFERVEPGDTILLASDGLWSYFEPEEMAGLIGYRNLTDGCDRLVGLARKRAAGNGDNLSVATMRWANGEKKRLLGALFAGKPVEPSPLEDCKRYVGRVMRANLGAGADRLAERLERASEQGEVLHLIERSEEALARAAGRSRAAAFALRARELLE